MLLPYIETTFLIRLKERLYVGGQQRGTGEVCSAAELKAVAHFTLLKRVDSFMMAVRE